MKALIEQQDMNEFVNQSLQNKRQFLNSINITELKKEKDPVCLKKYIAMKVFFETEVAIQNLSPYSFRSWLGRYILADNALQGKTYSTIKGSSPTSSNYRLYHVSTMGGVFWNRKFFDLSYDENYNVVTQKINEYHPLFSQKLVKDTETLIKWETDHQQLRSLFDLIKDETQYEHTFSYDFFCIATAAIFFVPQATIHGIGSHSLLVNIPLYLILGVIGAAISAVLLPPAIVFLLVENILIKPLQVSFEYFTATDRDEYDNFIDAVATPATGCV